MLSEKKTGMDLYDKTAVTARLLVDSKQYFSNLYDKAEFDFWIEQLITMKMPTKCPGGVYCLSGTTTPEVFESVSRSAYICNKGTYCQEGSSTPQGSGLCPKGFYCPEGTSEPVPATPGNEVTYTGNVDESQCAPGFYTYTNQTVNCLSCPSGYECQDYATI